MTTDFDSSQVIDQVTAQLRQRFPDRSDEDVRAVVTEEVQALAERPVTDYVAVLSTRAASKRLKHGG